MGVRLMPAWINRTMLSGASTAANGTASHTCTFTAATSGNFLVAIVSGAVTFTTPSGWTLMISAINSCGLYVFTKTASSGESSFSTTHNGSNYSILGVVYEFYSGTTALTSNSNSSQLRQTNESSPQVTGLTGTYTRMSARSFVMDSSTATFSTAWTIPSIEDYDEYNVRASQDGSGLTIAYDDANTGSSFIPSSTITTTNVTSTAGEGVAFGLSVVQSSTTIPVNWVTGVNG